MIREGPHDQDTAAVQLVDLGYEAVAQARQNTRNCCFTIRIALLLRADMIDFVAAGMHLDRGFTP